MKKRLTESQLRNIVRTTIKNVLKETFDPDEDKQASIDAAYGKIGNRSQYPPIDGDAEYSYNNPGELSLAAQGAFDDATNGKASKWAQDSKFKSGTLAPRQIHEKLINLGVRDITNTYGTDNASPIDFLNEKGKMMVKSGRGCCQWFIALNGKVYCSQYSFPDEDKAESNCMKFIRLIQKMGVDIDARECDFDAWVDGISLISPREYKEYYSDLNGADTMVNKVEGFGYVMADCCLTWVDTSVGFSD